MLPLLILPILVVYGGWRFVQAWQTGVLTGPKLGARRAEQPVTFAVNMALLGAAVVGAAWLFAGMLGSVHVRLVSS